MYTLLSNETRALMPVYYWLHRCGGIPAVGANSVCRGSACCVFCRQFWQADSFVVILMWIFGRVPRVPAVFVFRAAQIYALSVKCDISLSNLVRPLDTKSNVTDMRRYHLCWCDRDMFANLFGGSADA